MMSTDSCGIINAAIHAHNMVSEMISFYLNIAISTKKKISLDEILMVH